jgi:hypothetical protein
MALFGKTSERLKRMRSRSSGFSGAGDSARVDVSGHVVHHHIPLGARELRAQAVHRLQVGLFGLAAMLLLVSLASVIMQRVQTADRSIVPGGPTASASASPASDPLVDLGVAPEVPVSSATQGARDPHKGTKPDSSR